MKIAVSDIETNTLVGSDKLWLCGGKDLKTGEVYKFEKCHEDPIAKAAAIEWYKSLDYIVGHNFVQFDGPELNRLLEPKLIDPKKIIDTLLVSRMINYDIPTPKGAKFPHSLQAWGIRLGVYKGDFHDFGNFSDEMVEYWLGDLDTTEALHDHFSKYIYDPDWRKSMRAEHDVQVELVRTKYYGFAFDSNKAQFLLNAVQVQMKQLEEQFQIDFPPKLTLVNTIKYRIKQDGEEMASVKKAKDLFSRAASHAGLKTKIIEKKIEEISSLQLPLIILLVDKNACLLDSFSPDRKKIKIISSLNDEIVEQWYDIDVINKEYLGFSILIKRGFNFKSTDVDKKINLEKKHWFWSTIKLSASIYKDVIELNIYI